MDRASHIPRTSAGPAMTAETPLQLTLRSMYSLPEERQARTFPLRTLCNRPPGAASMHSFSNWHPTVLLWFLARIWVGVATILRMESRLTPPVCTLWARPLRRIFPFRIVAHFKQLFMVLLTAL